MYHLKMLVVKCRRFFTSIDNNRLLLVVQQQEGQRFRNMHQQRVVAQVFEIYGHK